MVFEIAFLTLFFLQVVVVSFYYPNQIIRRSYESIETFPPDKYPKLYGWPIEKWHKTINTYRLITRITFVVGLLILICFLSFGIPSSVPIALSILITYLLLQLACNVWRLMMIKKRVSAMHVNNPSTRAADLSPRHLSDYISTWHWVVAGISMALVVVTTISIAMNFSLLKGLFLGLLFLGINVVMLRSGLKVVQGEIELPQSFVAMNRENLIGNSVRSVLESMTRINVTFSAAALLAISGATHTILIAVSLVFLVNSAYEFFKELQLRDEDLFDMSIFQETV